MWEIVVAKYLHFLFVVFEKGIMQSAYCEGAKDFLLVSPGNWLFDY
jgi:hypothetical protein